MGLLWDLYNSKIAFLVSAGLGLVGFIVFLVSMVVKKSQVTR
ncbi:MAG: hypothetical protein SVR04_16925 [Spirochaetota bacterium]|nr:hypothetical protein [Spirochaetota bacterium]